MYEDTKKGGLPTLSDFRSGRSCAPMCGRITQHSGKMEMHGIRLVCRLLYIVKTWMFNSLRLQESCARRSDVYTGIRSKQSSLRLVHGLYGKWSERGLDRVLGVEYLYCQSSNLAPSLRRRLPLLTISSSSTVCLSVLRVCSIAHSRDRKRVSTAKKYQKIASMMVQTMKGSITPIGINTRACCHDTDLHHPICHDQRAAGQRR